MPSTVAVPVRVPPSVSFGPSHLRVRLTRRVMITDFQRRKLARRFETLDVNGSGTLRLSDYLRIASRLSQAFGLSADDDRVTALTTAYRRMWWTLMTDGDVNGDRRVDPEEFAAAIAKGLIAQPENFDVMLRPTMEAVFDAADVNGDGRMDGAELRAMLGAYGVPEEAMDAAVAHVVPEGGLDREGFVEANREYYVGDDPAAPGAWLFGDAEALVAA